MRTGYAFLLCLQSLGLITGSVVHGSAQLVLKDLYVGETFFKGFKWETMNDPTHGRVNYINQKEALRSNLSYGE